jgi:hypothetical protein
MTTRRRPERTSIGAELRKRFQNPREALKALGLDESLLDVSRLALDGAKNMTKKLPTRIEAAALRFTARAVNPLLAMDKKVEYGPIFAGLTTKNFKERKPVILDALKKALKGNTVAKDATMEHVAGMLDTLEHAMEPKMDESVSEPQHKAMEAAAHGASNIGIPKEVGKEFERADTGKGFDEMLMDWAKDRGMSEDDIEALKKMHEDAMPESAVEDEDPENALDETPEAKAEREKKETADKAATDEAAKQQAKDKQAMDARLKTMVTQDDMNKAIESAVKKTQEIATQAAEARAFVEPFVGKLPLALDSAEKIHRAAAVAMEIDGAETIHASALPTLIKTLGTAKATHYEAGDNRMALDSVGAASGFDFFPEAQRIGNA